ncbi:succinate dehydrogenase/fumarate reductase cytochrome b subunit [Helicobacter sp. 13S00482-2]|uniref:fumarate reductase cytochrome b subunit n=1 Tax=Helicobacter sp. 13S00482-2 TaxID=1476200 RepID=UPI000BA5ABCC|nr:fumarate reductase cytochrome b subunit [Helicobacter sp. 13S00482-2]PAF54561.1 succinate dehydrogenase/fumarate reductase cytochrome b subunit [Helicobacter sp. 13S00482-2]
MQQDKIIEGYLGITPERKKSKTPAKLDFWQSATGLFLALFMIAHMFLVSSILISDEAMYKVAKFFEGSFITKAGNPAIVSGVAVVIIIVLVVHAFLAMRKFPINYRQLMILKTHKHLMKHSDTSLWVIQAGTGFAMFFLASVHLFVMLTQPDTIGPNGSAYRFVSEHFWLLYIFLLFAVELHGSIGLYRLCIKWGWFEKFGIANLRRVKWAMSVFFIVLGLFTYYAYISKGLTQTDSNINYKHIDTQIYGKGE